MNTREPISKVKIDAVCPRCNRRLRVENLADRASFRAINYCRAAFLLEVIRAHPGISAWEASQITDLNYKDTRRGFDRLRDFNVVLAEAESRADGGSFRFRYWIAEPDGVQESMAYFESAHDAAVASPKTVRLL